MTIRHSKSSFFEVLTGSADEAGASMALPSYSNLKTQQMAWLESLGSHQPPLCETAVPAEELHWVLAEMSHSSSQAHCHLSWGGNAGATSGSGFIGEKDTQACQTAAQTWPEELTRFWWLEPTRQAHYEAFKPSHAA